MVTITPSEISALEAVLEQAQADLESYLRTGDIEADYPGEKPGDWVAARRSQHALVAGIIARAAPRK